MELNWPAYLTLLCPLTKRFMFRHLHELMSGVFFGYIGVLGWSFIFSLGLERKNMDLPAKFTRKELLFLFA